MLNIHHKNVITKTNGEVHIIHIIFFVSVAYYEKILIEIFTKKYIYNIKSRLIWSWMWNWEKTVLKIININ